MSDFIINSYFARNGTPETGLSPTIRIWEISNTVDTLVIIDEAMTEIGDGFYKYLFTTISGYDETKRYIVRSDANDVSLSAGERYSIGLTDEAALSSDTINRISDNVWDEPATDHLIVGSTGLLLNKISADTTQLRSDNITEITLLELLLKYETNKTRIDKVNYTLTVFDDDGTTPLTIFDLKDSNGQPSILEICERRPR